MIYTKTILLFIFFGSMHLYAIAQGNTKHDYWKTYPVEKDSANDIVVSIGKVDIIQDNRIEQLLEKHININKDNNVMEGYRIQLYSGSGNESKNEALEMKADFMKKYPDITIHVIWDEPNFKVKIGDFRTRLNALKFYNQILIDFPSAFVVRDKINFPELATSF